MITDMVRKVTLNLTWKYDHVRKELNDLMDAKVMVMGGKVLEFKGERIFREGEKEGRKEGKLDELVGLVYDHLISEKVAILRAKEKYGVSEEEFKEALAQYKPEDELMQG